MRIVCAGSFLIHIRVKEEKEGGFISVPGPLLLPVSYVASIWGGATSLFRRRLNQQLSRLSVRAPRGFAHRCFYSSRISSSPACFHSVSKEMREFSKCVFLIFSKPFFFFFSFLTVNEIETSKVFMRYLISFFLVFRLINFRDGGLKKKNRVWFILRLLRSFHW